MKTLRAALAAAAVLAAMPSHAQDIDMAGIKCKEFISASKEEIGNILAWLEGFYTKADAPPVLSTAKMVKDAKALSQYCNAHGDDGLIKAADAVMPRQ